MSNKKTMSKKREDILITAGKLFNEFGFVNVGVDKIILESKVAKMTFYKYFPSKDDLIKECLLERDKMFREGILRAINSNNQDGLSRLKSIFDWYNGWFANEDFFGCMFVKASDELLPDSSLEETIIENKKWLLKTIKSILNEMDIENVELVARQIRVLLDGAIINEKIFKDGKAISDSWLAVLAILDL